MGYKMGYSREPDSGIAHPIEVHQVLLVQGGAIGANPPQVYLLRCADVRAVDGVAPVAHAGHGHVAPAPSQSVCSAGRRVSAGLSSTFGGCRVPGSSVRTPLTVTDRVR